MGAWIGCRCVVHRIMVSRRWDTALDDVPQCIFCTLKIFKLYTSRQTLRIADGLLPLRFCGFCSGCCGTCSLTTSVGGSTWWHWWWVVWEVLQSICHFRWPSLCSSGIDFQYHCKYSFFILNTWASDYHVVPGIYDNIFYIFSLKSFENKFHIFPNEEDISSYAG